MKKSTVLLVILLMASVVYAEPKPKKKKAATSAKKESSQKYTASQIDLNLGKLPSNYSGNSPMLVYAAMVKRKNAKDKGEFETSEQYQKRLEKEKYSSIIGQITIDGLFAFKASDIYIKYSADNSEFDIDINLGTDFGSRYGQPKKIIIANGPKITRKYIGFASYSSN